MSRRRRSPRFPFIPLGIVISVVAVATAGAWLVVLPVMVGAIVLTAIQRGASGGGEYSDYDTSGSDSDSGGGFWDFFSGGDSSDSSGSDGDSGSSGCGGGCGGGGD